MSFDGQTASTLDVFDIVFPSPPRKQRRRPPRTPSTVDGELISTAPAQASDSSIEPMLVPSQPFTVATDIAEFRSWLERTGSGALVEVVARAFARHMNTTAVTVFLETESEDPNEQRVLVIAPISPLQRDALDRLFSFTSSAWWFSVVRSTRNAIVVDIQHA